jgi:hypothetical protein
MSAAAGTIGFDHVGIATALERNRLVVPVNQRDYAWEEKHVSALFQDLLGAMSRGKAAYFLGSIVLTTPNKGDALEVADGQQRLATTTILLAAIRDYFYERKDELVFNSIETDFLFKQVRETRQVVPRLTLNSSDHEFFENRILHRADHPARMAVSPLESKGKRQGKQRHKESHELLEGAAKFAAEHVQKIITPYTAEKDRFDVLNRWVRFLQQSAQVILLRVPDELNAFVMFETLNDRGRRTSQADLLKNYLFREADDRLPEGQHKWSSMVGKIESLGIDDIVMVYLRHLTISLYGHTLERNVYETIQKNNRRAGTGNAVPNGYGGMRKSLRRIDDV